MSKHKTRDAAYRWAVASRVAGAVTAGYAVAGAATVLLTLVLPLPRGQALLTATMLSFLIYACAVIWAYTASTATRAWIGLGLAASVMTVASAWLQASSS